MSYLWLPQAPALCPDDGPCLFKIGNPYGVLTPSDWTFTAASQSSDVCLDCTLIVHKTTGVFHWILDLHDLALVKST